MRGRDDQTTGGGATAGPGGGLLPVVSRSKNPLV